MKGLVIVTAVFLAVVGFIGSAASPNPSDHLAGKILIGIAAAFVALALYAPAKVTAWIYLGSVALVVVAYKLPMSFWRTVGLATDQPPAERSSRAADDKDV